MIRLSLTIYATLIINIDIYISTGSFQGGNKKFDINQAADEKTKYVNKLAITFLAHTSDWAALDWVPCQLASASPREKSAPQWQENVRHNKKASVGIYGNLWESMGIYGNLWEAWKKPHNVMGIRYCVPLKSLISVTAYR